MEEKATPRGRAQDFVIGILTAAACVSFLAGQVTARFPWLFQLTALLAFVAALYMLIRYRMTWFVYAIRPRGTAEIPVSAERTPALAADGGRGLAVADRENLDFLVYKGQGKRDAAIECVLGMDSLLEAVRVYRKPGPGERGVSYARERYPDVRVFDYTPTFLWQEAVLLLFLDGREHVALVLEPGETMASLLGVR